MKYRLFFWVFFCFSLVLFFAPIAATEATGFGLDKIVHAVLFAGLFYLGDRAFSNGIASSARGRLAMTVLLAIYAFAVEFVQDLLPFRSFDLWDMAAGWVGIVIAIFISRDLFTPSSSPPW